MKKFYAIAIALLMGASATVSAQKTVYLSTTSKMDFKKITETTTSVYTLRTLYAGYNTICLPFSVSSEDLKAIVGEEVMLEKLAKVEGNTLMFLDVTNEGIEAGVPYLIYSPKYFSARFQSNGMELAVEPKPLTISGVTMSGKYEPTQEDGLFGIPAQQDTDILQSILIRTEADKTFLPTRCGITYPGCKDIPTIAHVTSLSDATPITKLMSDNAKVSVYTVGGALVKKGIRMNDAMSTLTPGVYVVNGQKFIVK